MDTKRFHNPEYKRQIRAVRNHRRNIQVAPDQGFSKILSKVGLHKPLNKFLLVVGLALLIYIIYFARFLHITGVKVSGADQQLSEQLNIDLKAYMSHNRFLVFPQKNSLFFSKAGFKEYLLNNNYQVARVEQITLRPWNNLSIRVEQRVPKYLLEASGHLYILNSDATIGAEILAEQAAGLKPMKDTAAEEVKPGEKFFSQQKIQFIQKVSDDIEQKMIQPIASYEVPGSASDQLTIHMQKGFQIYFTTTSDPEEYFKRLNTLWLQLTPEQQNRLAYFDLRFEKNAYGCYKNDPCANQ